MNGWREVGWACEREGGGKEGVWVRKGRGESFSKKYHEFSTSTTTEGPIFRNFFENKEFSHVNLTQNMEFECSIYFSNTQSSFGKNLSET